MKTPVSLWLTGFLFPFMLQVSLAQTANSPTTGACLFCAPTVRPLADRFVFRSPCPDVLSSYFDGRLSQLVLTVFSEPENRPELLLGSYYRYVCNCRKMHRKIDADYHSTLSAIAPPGASAEIPKRPLVFKPVTELHPYSQFKTDAARFSDDNPWGGLGQIAIGLIRDIWVRN